VSVLASLITGTSVDEFLGRSDTTNAERVRDIGASMSTIGLLLALGVVVYLGAVHRGTRHEVRSLVLIAGLGGVALLAGATAELAGIQAVFQTGWADVLSVDVSSPAMMRGLGGLLVVFGLADAGTPVEPAPVVASSTSTWNVGPVRSDVVWHAGADSSFGIAGLGIAVLSFAFDGHTVTEGPRWAHLVADVVHVLAGGAWFGGIMALVVVAAIRHRAGDRDAAELIVRFSSVATVALVSVAGAGSLMAWFILDGFGELTSTVWGQRLTIKLVAVGVATVVGAYHHFVTVPRLESGRATPGDVARARTTIVVEAIVLSFVVIATTFLVNGSIN
jgi:copper transport protein